MTELEIVMKEKWKLSEYDGDGWWVEGMVVSELSGFEICHTLVVGVAEKIIEEHNKTIGNI